MQSCSFHPCNSVRYFPALHPPFFDCPSYSLQSRKFQWPAKTQLVRFVVYCSGFGVATTIHNKSKQLEFELIIFVTHYTELICNTTIIDLSTSPTFSCHTTLGTLIYCFWLSSRAHETIELLQRKTPKFISSDLWPPNSPDLNPVDYRIWGVMPVSYTHLTLPTIYSV